MIENKKKILRKENKIGKNFFLFVKIFFIFTIPLEIHSRGVLMFLKTWHFLSRSYEKGEFSKLLYEALDNFSPDLNQIHIELNLYFSDGWSRKYDPAKFSDFDEIVDLSIDEFSARIWFTDFEGVRSYIGMDTDHEIFTITIDSNDIDKAETLKKVFGEKFDLSETQGRLDKLIEHTKKQEIFPFDISRLVNDHIFSQIIIDRWKEANRTYDSESYLSTIILLGSILEGLLLCKIKANPKIANLSKRAPKKENSVLPFDKWTFNNLIEVAHDCKWIQDYVKNFSDYIRDYRNLVHPSHQQKMAIFPDKSMCEVVRNAVKAAIFDLTS